jgi:hypothetical protein
MMAVHGPQDDFSLTPPLPSRVAARALVLAAISCRGLIEKKRATVVLINSISMSWQAEGMVVLAWALGSRSFQQLTLNASQVTLQIEWAF